MNVDEFLDHHGIKGQQWGVRNEKQSSFVSRHKTGLKIAGGVVVASGAIYLASRNTKVRGMSKNAISSGKDYAIRHMVSKGNTKVKVVHDSQIRQIAEHHRKQLLTNPDFARMTPTKLMSQHNQTKSEFDRWLTLRERELGYLYKGPR